MSLRLRFTLIASGLLLTVLVAGGLWIAKQERALAVGRVRARMRAVAVQYFPDAADRHRPGETLEPVQVPELEDGLPFQIEYQRPRPSGPNRDEPIRLCYSGTPQLETPDTARPVDDLAAPLATVHIGGHLWFVRTVHVDRQRGDRGPERGLDPGGDGVPGRGPGRRAGRGRRPPGDRDGPPPRPRKAGAGPLDATVYVRADTALASAGHRDQIRNLWWVGGFALLAGSLLAFLLSGAMVRPIRRAALAAESIDRASQRLPSVKSRDELGRLVGVLNGMLARLEAGAEREKQFLATASHELRRPLAALIAELELSQRGKRSGEELEWTVALSLGDARRMARLVDDLLDQARIRSGANLLSETDVDLVDLVSLAMERAVRSHGGGAVEVGEVPDVILQGEREALGRLLENLIDNALTHGGSGVRVTISGRLHDGALEVDVEDDGPGIPEDERSTIFEPFGRGDQARTAPGAGLGLAIARDLARVHGGELLLGAPRAPGKTTRFTLRIPAERVRPVTQPLDEPDSAAP